MTPKRRQQEMNYRGYGMIFRPRRAPVEQCITCPRKLPTSSMRTVRTVNGIEHQCRECHRTQSAA